jgi:hypothetical protein
MGGQQVRWGTFGRSPAAPSSPRPSGECEMAITAIDHGGRVVTVTSQRVDIAIPSGISADSAFTTNVHGALLDRTVWRATSWAASLRNHATAVSRVIKAMDGSDHQAG